MSNQLSESQRGAIAMAVIGGVCVTIGAGILGGVGGVFLAAGIYVGSLSLVATITETIEKQ